VARAVERRLEHARHRSGQGVRLRAQRRDERGASQGGNRAVRGSLRRAVPRSRRPALHEHAVRARRSLAPSAVNRIAFCLRAFVSHTFERRCAMPMNLSGKSLLTLLDFSAEEIGYLLDLAASFKTMKYAGVPHRYLEGKNIVLLFEK